MGLDDRFRLISSNTGRFAVCRKDRGSWKYASVSNLVTTLCVGIALLLFATAAYSTTTGKIAGRVVDAETGQPMPGVNVVIDGTSTGAATDVDGYYFILNVSPGTYDLRASLIGYATTIVTVKVTAGLTTQQDFRLAQETITGDEVTIVAERSVVIMDRTNTAAVMDADLIRQLPVQSVTDLVQLQAGVVVDSRGGIHIRGGRSSEVAYLVDGISVGNQFSSSGGSLVSAEAAAIQEIQVISGTFNAEYGQAQSGVISVITKDPQNHFSGSVSAYAGDRISARDETFLGVGTVRPLSERSLEAHLTGPVPGLSKLGFYAFARQVEDDGFLFGRRLARPGDAWTIAAYETWFRRRFADDPAVRNDIIEVPDSLLTGDKGIVPMSPTERLFLNTKLNYRITPLLRITYSLFLEDESSRVYEDNFRFTPDALKNLEKRSQIHMVNFDQTLNARAFYSARLGYTRSRSHTFLFSDLIDSRLQTVTPARDRFLLGGTEPGIDRIENNNFLAKLDLTWQVDRFNLLKFGAQVSTHDVSVVSLSPEFADDPAEGTNFFPPESGLSFDEFLRRSRQALLVPPQRTPSGETGLSEIRYQHRPLEVALYAQNKVELDDLIINLGLRFDWFRPDHVALVNPRANPAVGSISLLSASETRVADASSQISPRLGIAFPISSSGVFHVAYGHFFKTPPFEFLYENSEYKVSGIEGPVVGNPDLKPQRTTSYEAGLQQEVFPNVGLDVTLFYSGYRNLVGLEVVRQVGNFSSYLRRTNSASGATRGVTISADKRTGSGSISGSLDYTFQISEGTESDPDNIAIIQTAGASGGIVVDPERQLLPLDWDQRHTLNATLTLGRPDSWLVSFIGSLTSGQPYTPEPIRLNVKTKFKNTENKPLRHNLDMYLTKTLRIGSQPVLFFGRVYNLLDQANELVVFPVTGRAGRDHRSKTEERLEAARLVGLFSLADVDTHQDWYSDPRRIQIGLTMSF